MAQEQYFGSPSTAAIFESQSFIAHVMTIGLFQREKLIQVKAIFRLHIAKY
jgi:hypothetical protein